MHIICLKEYLERAVVIAERLCGKNSTLKILQCFLLSVHENKIEIIATDLEQSVRFTVPGKIQQEGMVVVPAHLFTQFIQHRPTGEKIELTIKQKTLNIRTPASHITLQTLPTEEFPIIPTVSEKASVYAFPTQTLLRGIAHTVPFTAFSDAKPEITGVFLKYQPPTLTFVATDTFRLGVYEDHKNNNTNDKGFSCIVPVRAAQEFIRIYANEQGQCSLFITPQQLFFHSENVEFLTRLIEGNYPPYETVIPKEKKTTLVFPKKELTNQLLSVGVFAGRLQDVSITPNTQQQRVSLQTKHEGVGAGEAQLSARVNGEEYTTFFNLKYLLDGLQQCDAAEVVWWLNGATAPSLIQQNPATESATVFRYVLMPIRM